jgi:glycosyltransferase involved in cell wall biosynthesis
LVAERHPDAGHILAGAGPEEIKMVEWVSDNGLKGAVEFEGFVSGREKAQILVGSGIFVLPSYREGCSGALFKAMGAGLPLITTGVGGISNIVVDRENDILLDRLRPGIVCSDHATHQRCKAS